MKVYDDNIEQNFDIGYNVPYNVGYNDVKFCLLMLMAGQDPVVLPPSSPNPDNRRIREISNESVTESLEASSKVSLKL